MNQNATPAVDPSTPTLVVRTVTHKVGRGTRIEKMPVLITSHQAAAAFVARLNELRKTTEYCIDGNTKTFASVDEYDAQASAAHEDEAKSSVAKVVNRFTVADIAALELAGLVTAEKAAELRAMLKPKAAKELKAAQTQTAPTTVANAANASITAAAMAMASDDDESTDDEELDLSDADTEEVHA
jgi:hypothetical protein